jgi:hypothetical protein
MRIYIYIYVCVYRDLRVCVCVFFSNLWGAARVSGIDRCIDLCVHVYIALRASSQMLARVVL